MGTWKYRKLEPSDVRGLCCECGKNPQKRKPTGKYSTLCSQCEKRAYQKTPTKKRIQYSKQPYKKFKKSVCEECGFVPVHSCQLDIDHIDGNHFNNDKSNLRTLCANCHRLKTYVNQDWKPSV